MDAKTLTILINWFAEHTFIQVIILLILISWIYGKIFKGINIFSFNGNRYPTRLEHEKLNKDIIYLRNKVDDMPTRTEHDLLHKHFERLEKRQEEIYIIVKNNNNYRK